MNRISHTMLKVGMILSVVCGALILFTSPFFITIGVSSRIHDMIVQEVEAGNVNSTYAPEVTAQVVQATFLALGILFIILGAVCVADAIVASLTMKAPSRGRYIACIVLGFLSTEFTIAGGVLGLIYQARVRRNESRDVIDAE